MASRAGVDRRLLAQITPLAASPLISSLSFLMYSASHSIPPPAACPCLGNYHHIVFLRATLTFIKIEKQSKKMQIISLSHINEYFNQHILFIF